MIEGWCSVCGMAFTVTGEENVGIEVAELAAKHPRPASWIGGPGDDLPDSDPFVTCEGSGKPFVGMVRW